MSTKTNFIARFQTLFTQSALSAALGALIGYAYAHYNLPPELMATKKSITGGYVLAGAAAGLITMRLVILGKTILDDYFK